MGEYFPGDIRIGGDIKKADLDELCGILSESRLSPNYSEHEIDEEKAQQIIEQAAAAGETTPLLGDPSASYGMFDELERWLLEHRIDYDRHSDSHGECNAEWAFGRDGEEIIVDSDQNNHILLQAEDITKILKAAVGDHAKLDQIRKLAGPVEPLRPIRLVE